jgi:hypothetical protein
MIGGSRTFSMIVLLKLIMFCTTSPGESLTIKPMTIPTKKGNENDKHSQIFCGTHQGE